MALDFRRFGLKAIAGRDPGDREQALIPGTSWAWLKVSPVCARLLLGTT